MYINIDSIDNKLLILKKVMLVPELLNDCFSSSSSSYLSCSESEKQVVDNSLNQSLSVF